MRRPSRLEASIIIISGRSKNNCSLMQPSYPSVPMIRYCADPNGWDRWAISVYSDLEPGLCWAKGFFCGQTVRWRL